MGKYRVSTFDGAKNEVLKDKMRESYVSEGIKFFRPLSKVRSDYSIQIFPPTWETDSENTFWAYSIWLHHQIGINKTSFLCLKRMLNKPCPICEEIVKMQRKNVDEKIVNAIFPKQHKACFVRDLDDTNQTKPYFWAPSPNMVNNIVNVSKLQSRKGGEIVEKYRPIDDPDAGYYVSFHITGEKLNTAYSAWAVNNGDPFSEEDLEFVEDNPIPSVLRYYDYDYIKSSFNAEDDSEPEPEVSSRRTARRHEESEPEEEEASPRRATRRRRSEESNMGINEELNEGIDEELNLGRGEELKNETHVSPEPVSTSHGTEKLSIADRVKRMRSANA